MVLGVWVLKVFFFMVLEGEGEGVERAHTPKTDNFEVI